MSEEIQDGAIDNPNEKLSYNTSLELSKKVYENDEDDNINFKKNQSIEIKNQDGIPEKWKVINVIDDKETDLQAIAVKKENTIIIAYRGSQEYKDWFEVDPKYLIAGGDLQPSEVRKRIKEVSHNLYPPKELKNQFDEAVKFADKVKAENPDCEINTTGHSLGGVLATYTRVKRWTWIKETKTFGAPNAFGLLTKEEQEWVKNGAFKNNTEDFSDSDDFFGSLNSKFGWLTFFDVFPQVGTETEVDNMGFLLGNHKSERFIRIDQAEANRLSQQMNELPWLVIETQVMLEEFSSLHDEAIMNVEKDFKSRMSSDFNLVPSHEVTEIIQKYAIDLSGGIPKFYKEISEDRLLADIYELRNDTLEIADHLRNIAQNFHNKDQELANWLKLN